MWFVLPAKRSHLRGRLPEIKTTDGEVTISRRRGTKLTHQLYQQSAYNTHGTRRQV